MDSHLEFLIPAWGFFFFLPSERWSVNGGEIFGDGRWDSVFPLVSCSFVWYLVSASSEGLKRQSQSQASGTCGEIEFDGVCEVYVDKARQNSSRRCCSMGVGLLFPPWRFPASAEVGRGSWVSQRAVWKAATLSATRQWKVQSRHKNFHTTVCNLKHITVLT